MNTKTVLNRLFAALGLFCITCLAAVAQQQSDSTTADTLGIKINDRFSAPRLVDVQYEHFSASDYKMKNGGQTFEKGNTGSQKRLKVSIMVPFLRKKSFTLFSNIDYKYEVLELKPESTFSIDHPAWSHRKHEESHYFSGSLGGVYYTRLAGKQLIINANWTFDGSDKGYERMIGSATAVLTLRSNRLTSMSVGLYGSTSRASIFPFFPVFMYSHRFAGTPWTFDAIAPQSVYMRHTAGRNGRLSAGMMIDGNMFFVYPRQEGFKSVYTFDKVEAKVEAQYEHLLSKYLLLDVRAGFAKCYKGVMRERNSRHDIMEFSQNGNFYFSLGLSFVAGK